MNQYYYLIILCIIIVSIYIFYNYFTKSDSVKIESFSNLNNKAINKLQFINSKTFELDDSKSNMISREILKFDNKPIINLNKKKKRSEDQILKNNNMQFQLNPLQISEHGIVDFKLRNKNSYKTINNKDSSKRYFNKFTSYPWFIEGFYQDDNTTTEPPPTPAAQQQKQQQQQQLQQSQQQQQAGNELVKSDECDDASGGCNENQDCIAGTCVDKTDGADEGGDCTDTSDCNAPFFCQDNKCTAARTCENRDDCDGKQCADGKCVEDSDPGELYCGDDCPIDGKKCPVDCPCENNKCTQLDESRLACNASTCPEPDCRWDGTKCIGCGQPEYCGVKGPCLKIGSDAYESYRPGGGNPCDNCELRVVYDVWGRILCEGCACGDSNFVTALDQAKEALEESEKEATTAKKRVAQLEKELSDCNEGNCPAGDCSVNTEMVYVESPPIIKVIHTNEPLSEAEMEDNVIHVMEEESDMECVKWRKPCPGCPYDNENPYLIGRRLMDLEEKKLGMCMPAEIEEEMKKKKCCKCKKKIEHKPHNPNPNLSKIIIKDCKIDNQNLKVPIEFINKQQNRFGNNNQFRLSDNENIFSGSIKNWNRQN